MRQEQSKLNQIIFGKESSLNYGGNCPGLLCVLGPLAIPIYYVRYLILESREKRNLER